MRPLQALIVDSFRIVACLDKQRGNLDGEVFIDLEEHGGYAGTGTSRSRVSSAA